MPTLNRFPLLGLWAKEAARRLGYAEGEAKSLGHAYAVLYAIRARGKPKHREEHEERPRERHAPPPPEAEEIEFAGDRIQVVRDSDGRVRGLVGGETPQTPRTYDTSVKKKFPPGYYDKLEEAFRAVLKKYPPRKLDSRLVYRLYDEWKQTCGAGRLVDLDALLRWCHDHAARGAAVSRTRR
jgi:hypothetical protein